MQTWQTYTTITMITSTQEVNFIAYDYIFQAIQTQMNISAVLIYNRVTLHIQYENEFL
jgi:hypothetical protein